jgi:hypothetical protein
MAAPADQYRRQQAQIGAVLTGDLVRLLKGLFNPANPGPSWQATRMATAALIRDRRRQSADLATRFYRDARQSAGVPDGFMPAPPIDLDEDRLLKSIDATGIATYQKSLRSGATPEKAVERAAVTESGNASRLALEGGRSVIDQTVQEDDAAIGWARVTDADPCSWCAAMASRGAVYRNERTAGQSVNSHFVGEGQFKFHDHCGCVAAPVFDPDDPVLDAADNLYDRWLQVTAGHSGADALNVWRRYWEGRE